MMFGAYMEDKKTVLRVFVVEKQQFFVPWYLYGRQIAALCVFVVGKQPLGVPLRSKRLALPGDEECPVRFRRLG